MNSSLQFQFLNWWVPLLHADLDEGQKVTGIVTLNGVVHAWTFALSREPLHHALLDLKVFPCFSLHFFLQDSEEVSEKFSPVSHQV